MSVGAGGGPLLLTLNWRRLTQHIRRLPWRTVALYGVILLLVAGMLAARTTRIAVPEAPAVPVVNPTDDGGELAGTEGADPGAADTAPWRRAAGYLSDWWDRLLGREFRLPSSWSQPPPQAMVGISDIAGPVPSSARATTLRTAGRVTDWAIYLLAGVRPGEPVTFLTTEIPGLAAAAAAAGAPDHPSWQPVAAEPPEGAPDGANEGTGAVAGDPRVLIYHTHTQEAYLGPDYEQRGLSPDEDAFSVEPEENILSVGAAAQRQLEEVHGVGVVHVRGYFDRTADRGLTRLGAYTRSLAGVQPVLAQNPTVRVVLDFHRDFRPGLRPAEATASVGGQEAARVSIVIGRPPPGAAPNNHWRQNAAFARSFERQMNDDYPGVFHKVLVKEGSYNQHLLPGALLVEIGDASNTLEQAQRAGVMVADVVAALIGAEQVPTVDP